MFHSVRRFSPRLLLVLLAASVLLSACSSNDPKKITSPGQIYQLAKKSLHSNDYAQAIKYYEALEARFPFSPEAKQGQLDLMYTYYKNHATESAIDQADQFIRENPIHPRVDYAYYIKGLTWFERNPNIIERWFHADSTPEYSSTTRDFRSRFLSLDGGSRLELMVSPQETPRHAHIAISVGSRSAVDSLVKEMEQTGVQIVSRPRVTGDGYYEAVIADSEGNLVEVTA